MTIDEMIEEEKKGVGTERLTKTSNSGEVAFTFNLYINCLPSEANKILNLATKLKEYEDLEEQGRLIKLPCKEAYTQSGDIVYLIYDDEVVECTHCGLGINPVDGKAYITLATDEDIFPYRRPIPEYDLDPTDWCTNAIDAEVGEIGKTLFFTREEAEAKLKKMRGIEHGNKRIKDNT